jgi:integrase
VTDDWEDDDKCSKIDLWNQKSSCLKKNLRQFSKPPDVTVHLLMLMAGAGLRVGELVAIRIEDLRFPASYLYIPAANAKRKKERTVVLMPPVIDALRAYIDKKTEGWLFPSRSGDHLTPRQVQKILKLIADRSELPNARSRLHPHLLRHSMAIWALESGLSIYDLQRQLGHKSLASTGVYLEVSPNHRKEAFMRSGLLDDIVPLGKLASLKFCLENS